MIIHDESTDQDGQSNLAVNQRGTVRVGVDRGRFSLFVAIALVSITPLLAIAALIRFAWITITALWQ